MNHIEKLIARNIAAALIAAGKFVTVDYNEDEPGVSESSDLDAIIAACDAVDECWFLVDPHRDNEGTYQGFVRFIWGNGDEGRTCVSDYSVYLTEFVDPAVDGVDAELERLIALSASTPAPTFRFLVYALDDGKLALCEGGVYSSTPPASADPDDYPTNTLPAGAEECVRLNKGQPNKPYRIVASMDGVVVDGNVRSSLCAWQREAIGDPIEPKRATSIDYLGLNEGDAVNITRPDLFGGSTGGTFLGLAQCGHVIRVRTNDDGREIAIVPAYVEAIGSPPAKRVGTIDLTPTWAGIMPAMLAALTDGTPKGRDIAKAELTRLALIADALSETLTEIVRERVFGDGTADCEQRVIDLCVAAEKRFNIKRAA